MMRTVQNESIYTDTGHLSRYKRVLWDVNVGQKNRPQNLCTLTRAPPLSVHTDLFHHLQLPVKSTVVPNIYLHTKKS